VWRVLGKEFPWRRTLGSHLAHPRVLDHRREEFGEEEPPVPKTWREIDGFEKKATVQGFKYPQTRAWWDIVWANQTLSGSVELCLVRILHPKQESRLGNF
jgi:hypothetical protein